MMKRTLRLVTAFFTIALLLITLSAVLIRTQPSVPLATASRPVEPAWQRLPQAEIKAEVKLTSTIQESDSYLVLARHFWLEEKGAWITTLEFSGPVPAWELFKDEQPIQASGVVEGNELGFVQHPGYYVFRYNGQKYQYWLWDTGEEKGPSAPQRFTRCNDRIQVMTANYGTNQLTLELDIDGAYSAEKIGGQTLLSVWVPVGKLTSTLTGRQPYVLEGSTLPDNCK